MNTITMEINGDTYQVVGMEDGIIVYKVDESLPGIIDRDIRVEWVDLGEGTSGDFDPNDPEDVHLLRFDAFRKDENGEWNGDDGSYCTNVPHGTSFDDLVALAKMIARGISTSNFKRDCERMSWISLDDLKKS